MEEMDRQPVVLPFYARVALILLSVVLLYVILVATAHILVPLLFAVLVAILLLPPTIFFESKLRMGRLFAPLTAVALFIAILGGFLHFLALQLAIFLNDIPILKQRFSDMYADMQRWTAHKLHVTTTQQSAYVDRSMQYMTEHAGESLRSVVFSVSGWLLMLVFIFLFTFFVLYYRHLLMRFVLSLFSAGNRERVYEIVTETESMIKAYISGLVIEMLIMGLVTCIAFLIMDVPYAMLLGILVALLNVLPYIGIYTAIAISMLVVFANASFAEAIQAGAVVFVIHVLDANILFPRLIGGRVKMNPFVTILAVIIGQYLWGVAGMFLFVPIAGVVKMICDRVEALRPWSILMGSNTSAPSAADDAKKEP